MCLQPRQCIQFIQWLQKVTGWPVEQLVSALVSNARVRSPHGAKKCVTKVWDFTGHPGFSPGTPVSSLPSNNARCSQFKLKIKLKIQKSISFPFPNSYLHAFTPRVCTVYCCPCCVSVICLLHVSVYVGIDRRALSLNSFEVKRVLASVLLSYYYNNIGY